MRYKPKHPNHTIKLECDLTKGRDDTLVIFKLAYSPGTPDVMYLSNGDPGYPGSPAELEIVSAELEDGTKLTDADFADIDATTDRLADVIENTYDDDSDELADYLTSKAEYNQDSREDR